MPRANTPAYDRLVLLARAADAAALQNLLPSGGTADPWNYEVSVRELSAFMSRDQMGAAAAVSFAALAVAGSAPGENDGFRISLGWLLLLYSQTYSDDETIPTLVNECVPQARTYMQWVADSLIAATRAAQDEADST